MLPVWRADSREKALCGLMLHGEQIKMVHHNGELPLQYFKVFVAPHYCWTQQLKNGI